MSLAELEQAHNQVTQAIADGDAKVEVAGIELPAVLEAEELVKAHLTRARAAGGDADDTEDAGPRSAPIVIDAFDNFEDVQWRAKQVPRTPTIGSDLPSSVRATLKAHQMESFAWQVEAWKAGLPRILNADEQGLGKTLQTIAFLTWLKSHISRPEAAHRGPIRVVAPTSLLRNWEQEVDIHTEAPGLGHLIRLYGAATVTRKRTGVTGKDTDSGENKLDFAALHEAIKEGRGHRYWLLTTYTMMANYQHSLARIPFAAVVFDEIQAIKNPDTLGSVAARSLHADFQIGLTGTPIGNSTMDRWAIMNVLAGGSLGDRVAFRGRYGQADEVNMAELHGRVFQAVGGEPPLALRREKDQVARDLPAKSRNCIHA